MIVRGWDLEQALDPSAMRALLGSLSIRGPWITGGPGVVRFIERDAMTAVVADPSIDPLDAVRSSPIEEPVTTALLKDDTAPGSLPFALRGVPRAEIQRHGLASPTVAVRRRPSGLLAISGERRGVPALVCGFPISLVARRAGEGRSPWGLGHLCVLLRRWFALAGFSFVEINPWGDAPPPIAVSFDVEARVGQRSAGRTVCGVPAPGGRDLLRVDRLDLIRPMVSRRVIWSVNQMTDGPRTRRSFRLTVDLRPDRGRFADRWESSQWQASAMIPRRPRIHASSYAAFAEWCARRGIRSTDFVSGIESAGAYPGARPGYHGLHHVHFNRMNARDLAAEIDRARTFFAGHPGLRLIRAPGLLWSQAYLDAIHEAGIDGESSFREINPLQPITPFPTSQGWWHLPVHGHLRQVAARPEWVRWLATVGAPLNVYAHDHDASPAHDPEWFTTALGQISGLGFGSPMPLDAVLRRLRGAESDSVDSVTELSKDTVRVVGCFSAPGVTRLVSAGNARVIGSQQNGNVRS